jgi:hypothetical protein
MGVDSADALAHESACQPSVDKSIQRVNVRGEVSRLFAVTAPVRSSARMWRRRLGRAGESATTTGTAADTANAAVIATRSGCETRQHDVHSLAATHRG